MKRKPGRGKPPREETTVLYEIGRSSPADADGEEDAGARVRRPRRPRLEEIRREDGWIAVSKPAGVPSVRERWNTEAPTALSLLHGEFRRKDPGAPLPFVIHRIDKETSGLLLFGRDEETSRTISEAFRRRRVRKEYLALVIGSPPEPAGEIELRLLADPRRKPAMRVVRHRGKRSTTAWETEETFRSHTLLHVRPRSGRTHQIRVTLAHIGCPVLADPLYGGGGGLYLSALKPGYRAPRDHPERPLLGRLALHAHRLAFDLGEGDALRTVALEAPLPKDFRVSLERLRQYAAS